MTWEDYFNDELKKIRSTNHLFALSSIKNKILTLFGTEIPKEHLREKMKEISEFYEIKDDFFVCKKYLETLLIEDKTLLKEKLEFEYFLEFSDKDIERIILKKSIDNNEKIYVDLNDYEKLAIYISARSQRHFIKRFRECFNNSYSNFIMRKNIYKNGIVTSEALNISKKIEEKLNPIVGELRFLKWVTLPEIKLEELWIILEKEINIDVVIELITLLGADKTNVKEIPKTDKSEVESEKICLDLFESISPENIIYSENKIVNNAIKLIFERKSPLKLNSPDIADKLNFTCDNLVSVLNVNKDLFYFSSRKTVHFKPYIAGALVEQFYGKRITRLLVEKKLRKFFASTIINTREFSIFLAEYKDVFRWKGHQFEILLNPGEYANYIKLKYSLRPVVDIKEIIDKDIKLEEAAEKLEVSLEEMTSILNKRSDIFVSDGVAEKISEETLKIKFEKINHWFKHIDEAHRSGFNVNELEIILSRIVKNDPISADEVYKKLWLFRDRISKEDIEKLLEERNVFKKVDFTHYVSAKCSLYGEFKNSFLEELDNVLSNLKNSERKIFKYRVIDKTTLEEVGKKLNVTRERVRQIEKIILPKIQNSNSKNLIPYLNVIENIFKKTKLLKIRELEEKLNFYTAFIDVDIKLLLSIYEIFTGNELCFYFDNYVSLLSEHELLKCLQDFINQPTKYEELTYELEKTGIKNDKFLKDYIRKNKQSQSYKDFILIKEEKVNVGDKIRLIFYSEGRELKIEELTRIYNNYYEEDATEHTMQSRLLRYDHLFTRVFTGTYSLAEWGAEKHVFVTDLIEQYLRSIGRPANYQEILDNVRDRTQATEVTIRAFISTGKKTFSYSYGEWALIEWKDDPELSKKYHISNNRIQASLSVVTNTQYKGFFEKNGKKVSLHMAGGAYFKHSGRMNLGTNVFDKDKVDICIYVKDRSFEFTTYVSNGQSIYGVKDMLEYAGIKDGEYFYLEYWPDGNIALYTWDEFENYSKKGEFPPNPSGTGYGVNPTKQKNGVYEPPFVYNELVTFNEILRRGLETGIVDAEILFRIDFDNEKEVKDVHEAMEILEERGIRIPM